MCQKIKLFDYQLIKRNRGDQPLKKCTETTDHVNTFEYPKTVRSVFIPTSHKFVQLISA